MKKDRKSLYHQKTKLPNDFFPSSGDVICARGKKALEHLGNKKFRALVKSYIPLYSDCQSRSQKSNVVSKIMDEVCSASPEGGFVKKINGTWYQVSDRHAREKIGQTFRDLLHDRYASSTKAKAKVREERRREQVTTPCRSASSSSATVASNSFSEKEPVEAPSIITVPSTIDTAEKLFLSEDRSLQLERMDSLAAVLRIIEPDPVVVGSSNSDDLNCMDLEPLRMDECPVELELVDSSCLSGPKLHHTLLFDHIMEQFCRCFE